MIRADLGQHLREIRNQRGLSISALARASGLDHKTIRNIEAGKHAATADTLALLAKALDVPISALTDGPRRRSSTSRWLSSELREPLSGLTPGRREQIVRFARSLQETPAPDETPNDL